MDFKKTIGIIAIAVFGLAVFLYFLGDDKGTEQVSEDRLATPIEEESADQHIEPGTIGEEVEEDNGQDEEEPDIIVSPTIPREIFSTTGIVLQVKNNALVVEGSGTNFVDGNPRELTAFFTGQTKTFTKDKVKYEGMSGLEFLSAGSEVLMSSLENIRGKTEFAIKTISVLK